MCYNKKVRSDWTPPVATAVFHVRKKNGPLAYPSALIIPWPLSSFVEEEDTSSMATIKQTPDTSTNTLSDEQEKDAGRVNGNGRLKGNGVAPTSDYSGEQIRSEERR